MKNAHSHSCIIKKVFLKELPTEVELFASNSLCQLRSDRKWKFLECLSLLFISSKFRFTKCVSYICQKICTNKHHYVFRTIIEILIQKGAIYPKTTVQS